jgi:hypothetical protein
VSSIWIGLQIKGDFFSHHLEALRIGQLGGKRRGESRGLLVETKVYLV